MRNNKPDPRRIVKQIAKLQNEMQKHITRTESGPTYSERGLQIQNEIKLLREKLWPHR